MFPTWPEAAFLLGLGDAAASHPRCQRDSPAHCCADLVGSVVAQIPVPAGRVGEGMSSLGPVEWRPPPLAALPAYADGEIAL